MIFILFNLMTAMPVLETLFGELEAKLVQREAKTAALVNKQLGEFSTAGDVEQVKRLLLHPLADPKVHNEGLAFATVNGHKDIVDVHFDSTRS